MSHLYLRIGLGFSVGVDHFIMKHWGFSATHWTFQFRTAVKRTNANAIKHCHIHVHLFQKKKKKERKKKHF